MENSITNKKRKEQTISKTMFDFSYVIFIISTLISELGLASVMVAAVGVTSLLFAFVAIFLSIKKRKPMTAIALMLLFLLSGYMMLFTSGNSALVYLIIFSLAANNINCKHIVKMDLCLKIGLVAIVVLCSHFGLTQAKEFMRFGEIRNAFGFHHPNFAGLMLLNIYMDIVYLRKNKKSNIILGILLLIFVNSAIKSRSAAVGLVLSMIFQVLPMRILLGNTVRRKIVCFAIMLSMTLLSILFVTGQYTKSFKELDVLFSRRISISRAFYSYYGINMYGNEFETYGQEGKADQFFVLDNAYLYLLIHDGLIIFAAVILFYLKRLQDAAKNEQYDIFSALAVFAFVGLMEQAMFQPIKNPFLIIGNSEKNGEIKK